MLSTKRIYIMSSKTIPLSLANFVLFSISYSLSFHAQSRGIFQVRISCVLLCTSPKDYNIVKRFER